MQASFITLAMCAAYLILLYLFPLFFGQKITPARKKPWFSLACIIIFSTFAHTASLSIQDLELANRILHIFGGGFMGFFVCFLAARDSGVNINKFQFFVFSVLIVLALGIANELFEFFLQTYFELISAATVTDTWLDLTSNAIGIVIAGLCFVPFHKGAELDHI
jgi:hypothetical protein